MKLQFHLALFILAVGCSARERAEPAPASAGSLTHQSENGDGIEPLSTAAEATPNAQEHLSPTIEPIETSCGLPARSAPSNFEPMFAGICPVGCTPMPATLFDEANDCVKPLVLACIPGQINTMATCYKRREDGLIIHTADPVERLLGPAWVRCTAEDWAKWSDTKCSE